MDYRDYNRQFTKKTKKTKLVLIAVLAVVAVLLSTVFFIQTTGDNKGYRTISVVEVTGNVSVVKEGIEYRAYPGMLLQEGHEIVTAANSYVRLVLDDDKYVKLEAGSRLVFETLGLLGSGKTQMGIALIAKLGKRALWLTHTKDLLLQSKDRAKQYMGEALLGTITEGKVNIGAGITFATVQTMCNLDLTQYKHMWDVIIVDECHRVAGTPTAVSQFSKVLNSLAAKHKYGLSATVHRSDGLIKATFALMGDVIYTVPAEAVADKIMKVGICPVPTGIGISRACMNTDGTLNYAKLIGYLAENEERNRLIVEHIEADWERPSLILSDRLGHLETLMSMLPADMREDAVMVSGKMTTKKGKAEREQAIADMRSGDKKYLFATYSLCKEGLDIPRLERLYMGSPVSDYAVVTQSIGRIARTSRGKADPICYDFVDDIQYLAKAYKKRCTTYRKNGCYFVER